MNVSDIDRIAKEDEKCLARKERDTKGYWTWPAFSKPRVGIYRRRVWSRPLPRLDSRSTHEAKRRASGDEV